MTTTTSLTARRFTRQVTARHLLATLLVLLLLAGGTVEARNPDLSSWTQNLSEGPAAGEPGEDDFAPEIVVAGTTVHVFWITQNGDNSGHKLFYRRSVDNGRTWQAEQLLLEHDDVVVDKTHKRMVVIDGTVHIAYGYYAGNWYGVLGYLRSTDNGASFEAPRALFTAGSYRHVRDVRVAASEGKLSIGLRDQSNTTAANTYYLLNSDDRGDTFLTRAAYSTTSGSSWQVHDLHRVDDAIWVLYADSHYYYGLQYGRLYLAVSHDAGQTFLSTQVSVPSLNGAHKTYGLQDYHYVPKVAVSGDTVSVIWNGLDDQDRHAVFFRRSTDGGVTFDDAVSLSGTGLPDGKALQQGQETIAAAGDHVYAVFTSTAGDVYLRRSNDGGASFQPLQELSRAVTPYLGDNAWPVIDVDRRVADGSKVHVFWSVPVEVHSRDAGATFTRPALVSPYFSYGGTLTSRATAPQMAVGPDGGVHVIHRSRYYASDFGGYGDFDVFYRRLDTAPGPSGDKNALHLHSDSDASRYDNMQVRASDHVNFRARMTGEIWVRPYATGTTTGTTSAVKPVFFKREEGFRDAYALQTRDWYGERQAQAQIETADGTFHVHPGDASGLVPDGVWSHLAFTYDAAAGVDNLKLYLNGQLIASTTATGELVTGDGLLFVGHYGTWDVAELRLWDRALTRDELVTKLYTALPGDTPGLAAYYRFRNTTRDFSGNGNDGLLMYQETYVQQDFITELMDATGLMTVIQLLLTD